MGGKFRKLWEDHSKSKKKSLQDHSFTGCGSLVACSTIHLLTVTQETVIKLVMSLTSHALNIMISMLSNRYYFVNFFLPNIVVKAPLVIDGSFENEALENEDRSTKHPKLENEAPKTRNHCRLYVLHDAIRIRWRQRMRPHLQRATKSITRFYKSLPTV